MPTAREAASHARAVELRGGVTVRASVIAACLRLFLAGAAGATEPDTEDEIREARTRVAEAVRHHQAGRFAEAEPLYQGALVVLERSLGPDHPEVGIVTGNLAELYRVLGRRTDAEPLSRRSLAIAEKAPGQDGQALGQSLHNLAVLLQDQRRDAEAVPLFQRAIAIYERVLGPNHPAVGESLVGLAQSYQALQRQPEIIPLLERALAIFEGALGPLHPDVVTILNRLAEAHAEAGHPTEVERLHDRARAAQAGALKAEAPVMVADLMHQAHLLMQGAQYADAEHQLELALDLAEKGLGPEAQGTAACLSSLALARKSLGRFDEAEEGYRRALAILEKSAGPDHPDTATVLNNLAELMRAQRRPGAALLHRRALAVREKALGPEHRDVAQSLNNLGLTYTDEGFAGEAEPLLRRALAIREKVLGPDHDEVAMTLANLGNMFLGQRRDTEAEPLLLRALAIHERRLGPEHPLVAQTVNSLGVLYLAQRRLEQARAMLSRSLAIREKVLGPFHPALALALTNMADLDDAAGRHAEGLTLSRRAVAIRSRRVQAVDPERSEAGASEQQSARMIYGGHAARLARVLAAPATPASTRRAALDESFQTAQLALGRTTALAVSRMAARLAAGGDDLAQAIRERQDLLAGLLSRSAFDLSLAVAPPRETAGRNAFLEALAERRSKDEERLAALDERLAHEFPRYAAFSNPKPSTIAEIQPLLAKDEALLAYLLRAEGSLLWVVRHDGAHLVSLRPGSDDLARRARELRSGLDQAAASKPRGSRLLAGDRRKFDVRLAFQAYQALLAPAARYLRGITQLLLVLDGPLQGLPFGALVTEEPDGSRDVRKVAWLVRTHATTVLPSVGALPALRRMARSSGGDEPFVGFGDPELGPGLAAAGEAPPRHAVEAAAILRLSPLPETADELASMARTLHADAENVHLGPRATKARLLALRLSRYRVLAFSTHALMAWEIPGLMEPALVFTPPPGATTDGDALLLKASEIARLQLDADWVVLSACNTAAPGGTADGESLSGLASAFFYAGARALLVSHWAVDSQATRVLMTRLFELRAEQPALGRAEALRLAMLELTKTQGPFAEPSAWAPFVVVGDGR
jgi:CHAT domain-containing protein/Tfp pilus assembly protein PilF